MAPVSALHNEKCPRCGSGLVHLEWHERINAQEAQELWPCWNCKSEFVDRRRVGRDGVVSRRHHRTILYEPACLIK